ncbi:hypothetical protein NQZ68_013399 [Dissostichus eleginoides]|nr:hypothetical protein NQZ68_013399 [Dissostichus eleginoides]
MVLKGEDGFSQTRELHVPGCTLFRRNSQDTFIIRRSPQCSLGPVWGAHIWHDNSEPSPSWNIKHLDVSEVSRGQLKGRAWLFVAQCWLAVNQSDRQVERILGKCTRGGIGFLRKRSREFNTPRAERLERTSFKYIVSSRQYIVSSRQYIVSSRQYIVSSRQYIVSSWQYIVSSSPLGSISSPLGSTSEPHLSWSVLQLWAQDTWRKKYQVTVTLSSHYTSHLSVL